MSLRVKRYEFCFTFGLPCSLLPLWLSELAIENAACGMSLKLTGAANLFCYLLRTPSRTCRPKTDVTELARQSQWLFIVLWLQIQLTRRLWRELLPRESWRSWLSTKVSIFLLCLPVSTCCFFKSWENSLPLCECFIFPTSGCIVFFKMCS